jgi:hypothetical protein
MQVEADIEKRRMVLQTSIVAQFLGNSDESPYLILVVRRSNLVQDSLHQLAEQQFYLKKPLKVYFFFFYVLFGEGVTLFHTMQMRIFALTVVLLLVFRAQFGSNHLC